MSLSKILIFILLSLVFSKNVVIIGDSRACGFAYYVLSIPYTYHNEVYGTGSYIISEKAVVSGGHNIKVIAEVGASSSTFANQSKEVYKGVHNILSSSEEETVVLILIVLLLLVIIKV